MAKGRSWSAKKRTEVIEAYQDSGLSARAFALQEGISVSTLHGWLRARRQTQRPVPMARVVRRSVAGSDQQRSPILIEHGNLRVTVGRGFDREVLASVLEVLPACNGAGESR